MLQTNVLYVKIHAFYSQYAFSVSPLVFEIFNRQLMNGLELSHHSYIF